MRPFLAFFLLFLPSTLLASSFSSFPSFCLHVFPCALAAMFYIIVYFYSLYLFLQTFPKSLYSLPASVIVIVVSPPSTFSPLSYPDLDSGPLNLSQPFLFCLNPSQSSHLLSYNTFFRAQLSAHTALPYHQHTPTHTHTHTEGSTCRKLTSNGATSPRKRRMASMRCSMAGCLHGPPFFPSPLPQSFHFIFNRIANLKMHTYVVSYWCICIGTHTRYVVDLLTVCKSWRIDMNAFFFLQGPTLCDAARLSNSRPTPAFPFWGCKVRGEELDCSWSCCCCCF